MLFSHGMLQVVSKPTRCTDSSATLIDHVVTNSVSDKYDSISDPQLALNNFSDTFTLLYDMHFPLTTKKFNKNFHKIEPWITSGLLTSRWKKIELEKFLLVNPSPASKTLFKTFCNVYNKILRSAKKMYFEKQLFLNQSNAKQTWNLIRLAMNKKSEKFFF